MEPKYCLDRQSILGDIADKDTKTFLSFFESREGGLELSKKNRRELFYSITNKIISYEGKIIFGIPFGDDKYIKQLSRRLIYAYMKDILSEKLTTGQEQMNEEAAMKNILSKKDLINDENLYIHHSSAENIYNILEKGLMSHSFHDKLHKSRSKGSGGGWDREGKNEKNFICFWGERGYYKHLIDLVQNPQKYINNKTDLDNIHYEQSGDFSYFKKSPREMINLNEEQKNEIIAKILKDKKYREFDVMKHVHPGFGQFSLIVRTEEIPFRYMHSDVSGGPEVHFKHRIKPKQIIGVAIQTKTGGWEKNYDINLSIDFMKKCGILFSKPIYDEDFNLLWPRKKVRIEGEEKETT